MSNPTFNAPLVTQTTTLAFTLTVTDSAGLTAVDSVTITVNDVPTVIAPPIVDAGTEYTVNEGESVTLSGSGSDVGGNVTFSWHQTVGPSVELTGDNLAQVSFIAPSVSEQTLLTFQLTVSSSTGLTASDSADVTVSDTANGSPIFYNRRIKVMRVDFDNNGIAESVTNFSYNSNGTLDTMNSIYTDDGIADADFNAFPWGLPKEDEEIAMFYNNQGLVESLYTTRDNLAYDVVYDWISAGKLNTSIGKNYDDAGQLTSQIDMTVNYSAADLVSTVDGISVFPVSVDTTELEFVLSYDGTGAVASNLQTITSVINGITYIQQLNRAYDWSADGRISHIREYNPDPDHDYEVNRHFTYIEGRLVKISNDTSKGLFVWHLFYNANGLLTGHSMDIGNDDNYEASVELEWEVGACQEKIIFGPGAHPNPNKRLDDALPYTLADSHFTIQGCGNIN